ncbi:hypothetical protein C2845_PM02G15610 [Panicum miliaceum]|uniref:F-box domain-containing protein n=1 Tax=Panicum miliaceum TaxID=4540 RepID=A0A3L6SF98_PANMI|nr:hypothetical protein C2845_PM02G15610 [Panicum miliaceum]
MAHRRHGRRRRRCSSPAAPPWALEDDDLLADILLRLPPQPSTLPRAASVCRTWRRLVSDPGFLCRFRARHRSPPLLGVFMDSCGHPNEVDCWDLIGVRHGRVLIFNRTRHEFLLVWDPATGDRHCVAAPPEFNVKGKFVCNGAVICAAGEQGHALHGECLSGPFQSWS